MILLYCLMLASGLAVVCLAEHRSDNWTVREQETVQKTVSLSGQPRRVLVENVEGYVHITTGSGSQVRITAHKTIRAESDADLQQAKADVKLDISEQPGTVAVEYNAPWICRGDSSWGNGCHNTQRHFYRVVYDLDLEVPRDARPVVSTVNNGDVRVDGTTGDFDIGNVNGPITLTGIFGAGEVHTVNGPISVRFARNPAQPTSFKTVNGEIDAWFPADLSADLRFKTLHGEIFSDFDVAAVPVPENVSERQGAKFVYRSNGLKGGRIARGGPEITFNTLNGSVRLHRN